MSTGSTPQSETRGTTAMSSAHADRLSVLAIGEDTVVMFPLPDRGEVVIGRGEECEILIDDGSISRRHAALEIGSDIKIRDLGSSNGTFVRQHRLMPNRPVAIAVGEAVTIGKASLLIQRRTGVGRPRRFWPHDYFEVRLDEECARAMRSGATFVIARLLHERAKDRSIVRQVLAESLRAGDVIGEYGPREFEALLLETDRDRASETVQRLVAALDANGVGVRTGLASFPADGSDAQALLVAAAIGSRPGQSATPQVHGKVIVQDPAMKELYRLVERIAGGTIGVLILGETGAGKEVLAERLHDASPRRNQPFLRLNCAAFTETLLESELFGHERGAFTGAVVTKTGLLEAASGGSVFLDEIGELPTSLQVKLLRVIEAKEVLRVGAIKPRPIDVRFIAATNRDVEAEVAAGRFRGDLYFRLNGVSLMIPPLRDRSVEIEALARAFVDEAARALGQAIPQLAPEALAALHAYSWPGNVRELRNAMERAVLLAGSGPITARHLPIDKMKATYAQTTPRVRDAATEATEADRIVEALNACAGNQSRAAKMLGISRGTLINRLDEYGIARPRKRTRRSS
jgi:DNA-binding NtrC family response regulator